MARKRKTPGGGNTRGLRSEAIRYDHTSYTPPRNEKLAVSTAWKTWGGDEPWTRDDIAWFAKRPSRSYRLRPAFPDETIHDITYDDKFQVVVWQKRPTVHVRVAANFDTAFDADDEDLLEALFEVLRSHRSNQQITARDIALLAKHGNSCLTGPRGMMANILISKAKGEELVENKFGLLEVQRKHETWRQRYQRERWQTLVQNYRLKLKK